MSNQSLSCFEINEQYNRVQKAFTDMQHAISASGLSRERMMAYRRACDTAMTSSPTAARQLAALEQISLDLCIEKGLVSE